MPEGIASVYSQQDGAKDKRFTRIMGLASCIGLVIFCGVITMVLALSLRSQMTQLETKLSGRGGAGKDCYFGIMM